MSQRRVSATAQEWSPAEEAELARGALPTGARLVAIRTELVELCRLHAPAAVPEAERLLARAALPAVSALFVDPRGPYPKLLADWWDEKRDARLYAGPNPVVAHPPCERWGRYWGGGPMLVGTPKQKQLGDDGGCFAAALAAVRAYGGILEHPEASHAFTAHGLRKPIWRGGWQDAGDGLGMVCCVAQGNYGHRARKLTWLYAVAAELPELDWSIPSGLARLDNGNGPGRRRVVYSERIDGFERLESPPAFAALLIRIAASGKPAARAQVEPRRMTQLELFPEVA